MLNYMYVRTQEPWHIFYLFIYAAMGTSNSLLVAASRNSGIPTQFDPVAVALTTEFTKLTLATVYYFFLSEHNKTPTQKVREFVSKWQTARLFIIPAGLYCVFNALLYVNMQLVPAATYRILINTKVLYSGVLLQYFFNITLSRRQWIGLLLLVIACCIEQVGSFDIDTGVIALVSISGQAACSSLAGVYFQWLLQRDQKQQVDISVWEKNIMLYMWSSLLNTLYLLAFKPHIVLHPMEQWSTFNVYIQFSILASSFGGFSTSLILRYMDVIVKEYANFVEMLTIVIGQYILFSEPLKSTLMLAVLVCSASLYMYNVPAAESSDARSAASTPRNGSTVSDTPQANQQTLDSIAMTILNGHDSDDDKDIAEQRRLISRGAVS